MSTLTRFLFPAPDYRRTPWTLLRWWEARRPLFNLVVGGAGLVTLGVVVVVSVLPPVPPRSVAWGPLLGGVVVYGLLANVCYSLGWAAEVGMRALWGEEAPLVGPALFRQGLSFALGLTLLPIPVVCLGWVVRLVAHLF